MQMYDASRQAVLSCIKQINFRNISRKTEIIQVVELLCCEKCVKFRDSSVLAL